jgi:plasmid stability protein
MVPYRNPAEDPVASITLKDIPDEIHGRLRDRAARNRRSLQQEILACLEAAVMAGPVPDDVLDRARVLRRRQPSAVRAADLERSRREGRT